MGKKGSVIIGGACVVTEGVNKGKKGTYRRDEFGNLWCEGDWGGTQCLRCKPGVVAVGQVYDYASTGGGVKYEADGLFTDAAGDLFHVKAEIDVETKQAIHVSTAQILPIRIAELKKASSPLEQALGAALEKHLSKQA